MMLPAVVYGFVAAILDGDGIRTVISDKPWSIATHVQPGEQLFLLPNMKVPVPVPWGMWPWTVGAAEIHVATAIFPVKLRWGIWEAEEYFRKQVLPHLPNNRPSHWWQRPSEWQL